MLKWPTVLCYVFSLFSKKKWFSLLVLFRFKKKKVFSLGIMDREIHVVYSHIENLT